MEGLLFRQMMVVAVPLVSAFLTAGVLLRDNRQNKNPLDWTVVDRCLLIIALFCFAGGLVNIIISIGVTMPKDLLPWANWGYAKTLLDVNRYFGMVWIILMIIGFLLRKKYSGSRIFGHIVIQYNAFSMAGVCYIFGPVTHPGPFVLSMALGTFYFLLFDLRLAIPWLITFLVLIITSAFAVWGGIISYAPFFTTSPFSNGDIDTFYLFGTLVFPVIVFPVMLSLIAYVFVRWRDRETKVVEMTALLKKMFGRYLSTEVMKTILDDPTSLELGGERRSVTIMMTDLRGFTAMSERLEPEQVVKMLNSYFEVMVDILLQYKGTINEIIGDALLVIFGAPQELPDRARQAIACALAMQNAMKEVNARNRELGLPDVDMGIGLNEAEVIVGNIGSSKRSKYGVVGSGVNMASRIESYSVGGQLLISESVRKEAGDILRIDGQRDVLPKGAESPIRIFEIGGIAGDFNIVLEDKAMESVRLAYPIPLQYALLDGKDVEKKGIKGVLYRLSKKNAEIDLKGAVDILTNIKMNLIDVEEGLAVRDFYGKVIERAEEGEGNYLIQFTAVPSEVASYFQAARRFAVKAAEPT